MFDWVFDMFGVVFDMFLYAALFVCVCMIIINVVNYFTSEGVEYHYVEDGVVYGEDGKPIVEEEEK